MLKFALGDIRIYPVCRASYVKVGIELIPDTFDCICSHQVHKDILS